MTKEEILELSHKLIKDQAKFIWDDDDENDNRKVLAYICGVQDMVDVLFEEMEENIEEDIEEDTQRFL